MSVFDYEIIADEANREDWLLKRQSLIGASETAGLLHDGDGMPISKYVSPLKIAVSKMMPPEPDEANEIRDAGNWLEPHIAERFLEEVEKRGMKCGMLLRSTNYPWLGCTPDWWVMEKGTEQGDLEVPLQIKNTMFPSEWNEGVPLDVEIQVQTELIVTGAPWAYVAVLWTGNRLRWEKIYPDEALQQKILDASKEFWEKLQDGKPIESDGHRATKPSLAKIFPDDTGLTVPLSGELMGLARELHVLGERKKEIEAALDELGNALRSALGNNSFGTFPDGASVSHRRQTRKAEKCGNCNAVVRKASSFKVLRLHLSDAQKAEKKRTEAERRAKAKAYVLESNGGAK